LRRRVAVPSRAGALPEWQGRAAMCPIVNTDLSDILDSGP
jgi:hypothetical protein